MQTDVIHLYRVVGVREEKLIRDKKVFLPGGNSMEARQFAFTEKEVLDYAETDSSKTAVVRVVMPKHIMQSVEISTDIDVKIFTNGVVSVQPDNLDLFNKSIISIEFIGKVGN